jgi:hypothetical protein
MPDWGRSKTLPVGDIVEIGSGRVAAKNRLNRVSRGIATASTIDPGKAGPGACVFH